MICFYLLVNLARGRKDKLCFWQRCVLPLQASSASSAGKSWCSPPPSPNCSPPHPWPSQCWSEPLCSWHTHCWSCEQQGKVRILRKSRKLYFWIYSDTWVVSLFQQWHAPTLTWFPLTDRFPCKKEWFFQNRPVSLLKKSPFTICPLLTLRSFWQQKFQYSVQYSDNPNSAILTTP